jgi:hypothetical protein
LVGSLIGDVLGAYVFNQNQVKIIELEEALLLKGGGPLNLEQGQLSDVGELTLLCFTRLCLPSASSSQGLKEKLTPRSSGADE